jgi:hypothetical protein
MSVGIVRRRFALVLALWWPLSCRAYTTVPANTLAADSAVRVLLTDQGSLDLAAAVGPRAEALDGRLTAVVDSTLALRVLSVRRTNGVMEGWDGETVRVPLGAVVRVERERVSAVRSGLLAGGVLAMLAAAAAAFGGGEEPVAGGGPGGTPPPGSQ